MGEGNGLKFDPAIERWGYMRNTTHTYFRFNKSKLFPLITTVILIPSFIYFGIVKGFVRLEYYHRSKVKVKGVSRAKDFNKIKGTCGVRTHDLLLTRESLLPLSQSAAFLSRHIQYH